MSKIKIGIIGTGVGIRTHYKGFKLFEDSAEVYAIAGSSYLRSVEFAEKYEIPVACADYKELCDMNDIDLICITTPNKYHKEMLEYAISRKKHIICEKPMVTTAKDVCLINNLTKKYDHILIVDHQLRFNPYIAKIKELIDSGTLGKIYNVKINQQGSGFANENLPWSWSFDGDEGGGVRLAMASHFTDLIQFWFDNRPVISVSATLNPITKKRLDKNNNEKNVIASTTCDAFITLKDELTVHYSINAGSYSEPRFDISIFGDRAELSFSLQDKLRIYYRSAIGKVEKILPEGVYSDELENKISIFSGSFRYLAPELIYAIQSGDTSRIKKAATPIDAKYNIDVLEAIKKAANSSGSVSFGKETNIYV